MSPLDELLLVFLALYLYESTWCVPAGAWLFVPRWRGGLRDVRRTWVESGELGFVRAPLLTPATPQLLALPFPIALAPEGFVAWDGPRKGRVLVAARGARWIAFEPNLTIVADGKRVRAGAEDVARFDSEAGAAAFARSLAAIAARPLEQRTAAIHGWIAERLAVTTARVQFQALKSATLPLRVAVAALFLVLGVALPVAAYRWGLVVAGPWLLGAWLVATIGVLATWRRAEKLLRPEKSQRRLAPAIAMVFYPVGAVRALDLHARGALAAFDPVAVALAAGDAATRDAVATVALRETLWPLSFDDHSEAVQHAAAWYHAAWERELLRELLDAGIEPKSHAAEPAPRDSRDRSFCPRCRAHYASDRRLCADCDGVALVPFEANIDDDSVEDEEE
ncbi:MAG TPA: hypothetical protein VFG37_04890 [Planctomycetota bacterium]|nr:hypothetical protein [Planctomycetota bacterium]